MTEQVRIDLEANDKASGKIEDVADAAADLERADAEVTITAKDNASTEIADVEADARALSKVDAEIVLKARADTAKAELAALRADLEQTGEKAEDTARQLDRVDSGGGLNTRGNAIADLTGPLGEASGAASDFAGVMDGLGDIVGDTVTKLGATPELAGKISGALGGLGIAVAAGAAVWSIWTQKQKAAEEAARATAEATEDLNEAIRDGNREAATTKFHEVFGKAEAAAKRAGIPLEEYVKFLTGAATVMPTASARAFELGQAWADSADQSAGAEAAALRQFDAYNDLVSVVTAARDNYAATNETIGHTAEENAALADALGLTEDATDDAADAQDRMAKKLERAEATTRSAKSALDDLRGALSFEQAVLNFQTSFGEAMAAAEADTALTAQEILDLKTDYLTVAEDIGKSPIDIATDLKKIEDGDIAEVLWTTQEGINRRPPLELKTRLGLPVNFGDERFYRYATPGMAAATSVTNVYQTIPRGFRGDVLAEARRQAARSGRLYRATG
jgi:type II secretory pathway pseudopilin PulG